MIAIPSVAESIAVHGYVHIRQYKPASPSLEAIADFGHLDTVEGINSLQSLIPHDLAEAPPNTYSGIFGRNNFPLHTDL